uniref:F-box domain-containing protein n=1 Tax=Ditylenchus dipsaci TaxID=166011 RepID=A0A915CT89_9BILA
MSKPELQLSNDILYGVFAFLNRDQLDDLVTVSRQFYWVTQHFSTFPYRIIKNMQIDIFREITINWNTPRPHIKQFKQIGIYNGISRSLYTYDQNLVYLKKDQFKVETTCIMLSTFYNKQETVQGFKHYLICGAKANSDFKVEKTGKTATIANVLEKQ